MKRATAVAAESRAMDGDALSFGPFRLFAGQRLLLAEDKPVRLGSRAFDILAALVERAGEVVGKEELIARAWPQTFVEESNLKIQMSALRRVLGDGQDGHRYIVTVPGQGYNFVAPIRAHASPSPPLALTIAPARTHNLPTAVTRMIGREDAVAALVARLSRERLVTITGPGGVGKSTVALAVAERLIVAYEHGVRLVDLAPLSDPRLVPSTVAIVLGLEIRSEDPLPGLLAWLRDKRMLLLLDNCEHVIVAASSLAATLLSRAPGVAILSTSREPLGVAGEHEHRLGPLSCPQPSATVTAAEAAAFPAVQLFVERVTAVVENFVLTDANAPLVVDVCRRLDGLPLAIEFVAPRVAALGVEGLATRLNYSLPLSGTRRATTTRQRTMWAVVEWSYSLLSGEEQLFFRALCIFAGGFAIEAAAAVAMDAPATSIDTIDRLADLAAKSLIVADVSDAKPRFRLFDTTRAYAIEKLDESGDRQRIARRHAAYYRDLFKRAEGESTARPTDEWLADYGREIDNLRAALDWAFSPAGDGSIGVALTAEAFSLWMRLSLLEECRSRVKRALGALGAGETRDQREEMRLQSALGASTAEAPEMGAAFTKALGIAESLGDTEHQLRALSGLHFYHTGSGRYRAALPFAQRFLDLAARGSQPYNRLYGERTMGVARHFLGDQISARRHLDEVLTHSAVADRRLDFARYQTDLLVTARVYLARVQWLQGYSDQAARTAERSIEEARESGHAISLCLALALAACPVALWREDLAGAAIYTQGLLEHARAHSLPLWGEFGARFQSVIAIKAGNYDKVAELNFRFPLLTGVTDLAEALARAGRTPQALAMVELGIEHSDGGWITPELLRLKGELFLSQGAPAASEPPEALFRQALDEARQQGALSWELRAATSLARLLRNQGRHDDAMACLNSVYDRFSEGFGTADLIAAKQLLDERVADADRC
jgi:predicted ATPase/DNA-binding winged helix-turn-helix (wHTH) protein